MAGGSSWLQRIGLTRLDRYIMRKFLSTFFFMIGVFCVIAVVFDLMEYLDDLLRNEAPLGETLLYYLSFCFYFGNLLSGFIVFLTIIWFTSRLAQQTEVIAMLSGGMSFRRFLRPYFLAATLLAGMTLVISHWILPLANGQKLDFDFQYIHTKFSIADQHLYREIQPGVIAYFRSITVDRETGYRFQLERWNEAGQMTQHITAAKAQWQAEDSTWHLVNAAIRDLDPASGTERFRYLTAFDTTLTMRISDFGQRSELISTMTTPQLDEHIAAVAALGAPVTPLVLERHARTTNAFTIFVMTLIGVAVASRKQRGGMGMHLFLAVLIAFAYVFSWKLITVYAAEAPIPEGWDREAWWLFSAWLPNLIFGALGVVLYRLAPK